MVVLCSTRFLYFRLRTEILAFIWAGILLFNAFYYSGSGAALNEDGESMSIRQLLLTRILVVCACDDMFGRYRDGLEPVGICFAGGLKISKQLGMAGPCLFAILMGYPVCSIPGMAAKSDGVYAGQRLPLYYQLYVCRLSPYPILAYRVRPVRIICRHNVAGYAQPCC